MRGLLAFVARALAAAVAWLLGIALFFGPAQRVLADPARQSAKFIAAFSDPAAPPRMAGAPWVVPAGLVLIGLAVALAYALVRPALPGGTWRRGATFGGIAWLLMVPWFEFYLPWNVMLEPLPLVLLEAFLWALVLQLVGAAVAWADRAFAPR